MKIFKWFFYGESKWKWKIWKLNIVKKNVMWFIFCGDNEYGLCLS